MIVSSYGREGDKAMKYSRIGQEAVHEDDLFSDIVGHWVDYFGWDDERDEIYPEEGVLFEAERPSRTVRLRRKEDTLELDYGIPVQVDNSKAYVESVWQDEMETVLSRNSETDLDEFYLEEATLSNLTDEKAEATV